MYNLQKVEVMFRKTLIIALLFISISACDSEKKEPVSTLTRTPITISPTFQPKSTPSMISTPNDETRIIQATNQAFDEIILAFPSACKDLSSREILISPDGKWLAGECNYSDLQIINSDGSIIIKVTHEELFGEYQGGIHPLHWTNDSQFLYFSANPCCWDPLFQLLSNTVDLYKLNVANGHYELFREGLFDLSFSPTGKHITFIEELETPLIVEIQDAQNGSSNRVVLEVGNTYSQAQVGIWSRDGSKFVIKAASGINYDNTTFDPDQFTLILVDTNNLSQKVILKNFQTTTLNILDWTEDDTLIFQTGGGYITELVSIWEYTVGTEVITISAQTP